MNRTPLAFMSYVNDDDKYANGKITKFREHLSRAVKAHSGKPFEIFQDKEDIKWGQQWQERINDALDATLFLIPIITPSFFNSKACREELERFLKREKELGRNDLILPVHYIECPVLKDNANDTLAEIIAAHQYTDWCDLRDDSFTTRKVRKALAKLAQQIMEALERSQAEASRQQPEKESEKPSSSANTFQSAGAPQSIAQGTNPIGTQINNYYAPPPQESKPQPAPTAKTDPPTVVVDALHRGDYTTITEALKVVKPGTRILVRPGLYREGIVIDKPVEIVGDGDRNEIVIEASGDDTVCFIADMGKVSNLTLRQIGNSTRNAINIAQGRLDLEDCDISSQFLDCVVIHSGSDPRLRRNRIHGKGCGVVVYKNSQGTIEDNEIFANAEAGIEIRAGGNPTVRRNHIHNGKSSGIYVHTNGQGTLENNDIFANAMAGVEICTGSNPAVRCNRIHDGKRSGIFVQANGQGILEDNEIFANAEAGIEIRAGGHPTLLRNRISENGKAGVWVHEGGGGIFKDNDLRDNTEGAWAIDPDCESRVHRRGNKE